MCGIVGYVGGGGCVEVLIEGLGHLEYRGYDSAGLAVQREGTIERLRKVGPLSELAGAVAGRNGDLSRSSALAGIGHTRWATHGKPSEENAHPHLGGDGSVAVVHNGIIENYAKIKEDLQRRGRTFASETDTEVIAQLLEERVAAGESLEEAFRAVLPDLKGSFAVAAVSAKEPGVVVAARRHSPLVVGLGDGENFLASAVQALLGRTRRFLIVENGEVVVITPEGVEISDAEGNPVRRDLFEADWDARGMDLGGFEDYMLKEIHEQPGSLRATLADYLDATGRADLFLDVDLREVERVVVVACGTAYHAGLLGKTFIERLARVPVEVAVASEYRYSEPVGDEKTLVVAISQSGETIDTLAAVEAAKGFGGRVVALTNTRGSLITRESDAVLFTKAGPEIAVASTKAFTTQVAVMQLLALELARAKRTLPEEELLSLGRSLRLAPEKVEEALEMLAESPHVLEEAVEVFEGARCALFLGRGAAYPVALEGSLKMKEISYVPAEGYPSGEMKHGPIALVDEWCPVVAVLGEGAIREKTLSNVDQTSARGANVISVARPDDTDARRISRVVLPVPPADVLLAPLVDSVPLQLLAYRVAKSRNLNVDKPRNLAKSVTVE